MKLINQKGIAPIVIVILIGVALVGYLAYTGKINISQKQTDQQIAETSIVDETANPDSIGANWKTYTNAKYQYEVRYPSDWDIVDVHSDSKVTFGPKAGVTKKPPLVSIHVFETSKFKTEDIQNYTPFDYKILEKDGYTYFFVASTYQIGAAASPETEKQAKEALEKIYSTFKFAD